MKYGAWTKPGARETERLAWRARVEMWAESMRTDPSIETWHALRAALSAPRPWRTGRKPDPRRRYSRAHRRACVSCREVWRVTVMCGMRRGVGDAGTERGWNPSGCAASMRRDPHGRRP